jgi:HD-GYP domain-containing protein (c-di-GMP phosphodiesterase class II)
MNSDEAAVLEFVKTFTAAVGSTRFLFPDHPQAAELIDQALGELKFLTGPHRSLTLLRVEKTLVINSRPSRTGSPAARKFLQVLEENGLDSITFDAGLTREELTSFIRSLASREQAFLRSGRGIILGTVVRPDFPSPGNPQPGLGGVPLVLDPDEGGSPGQDTPGKDKPGISELKGMFEDLKTGTTPAQDLIKAVNLFIDGFIMTLHPMEYLGSIKFHDEYTFVHCINVFVLTTAQAQHLGFRDKALHDIGVAAVLHDVGKLFIPDGIINKPGRLTDGERAVMQTHSMLGARYLMEVPDISRLAAICAMDHHIRFDGSGYPLIRNWKPCLVSQMIAISDAFDAMRSRRPYQEPRPQSTVIEILRKDSGTAFNPVLVDSFLNLLGMALVEP